jgi:hypothetical protein
MTTWLNWGGTAACYIGDPLKRKGASDLTLILATAGASIMAVAAEPKAANAGGKIRVWKARQLFTVMSENVTDPAVPVTAPSDIKEIGSQSLQNQSGCICDGATSLTDDFTVLGTVPEVGVDSTSVTEYKKYFGVFFDIDVDAPW